MRMNMRMMSITMKYKDGAVEEDVEDDGKELYAQ